MNELLKIRDVALKYDISARTLRYYEDMGLISSIRNDDYAYCMYDEKAVGRLEQILLLRKLNINIKDIKRIFDTDGTQIVLEVLGKKVKNIDDEVALLHELKEIVLELIQQIEQADLKKESDVKTLYAKAKEIELQINNVDYEGNPSNVNRLLKLSEKIERQPDILIVEMPSLCMVTSGPIEGDEMGKFNAMWTRLSSRIADKINLRDYMYYDVATQKAFGYIR